MKYYLNIALCFAVLMFHDSYLAQNKEIRFKHLTTEEGLSQSCVFSIVQDDIGFMWFATEDGLNKFDGNKFTVFRNIPGDSTSLPELGVKKIFKDKSGNLWVITLAGKLCRYNFRKNNFIRYSLKNDKVPSVQKISALAEDVNGNLFAAGSKGDFFSYNKKKDKFVYNARLSLSNLLDNKNGSQSIQLQCVLISGDGVLWLGTWDGLISYDPKTKKVKRYVNSAKDKNSLGGNLILNLAEDNLGNIWIASADGGLSVFNKSTSSFKVYKHNPNEKNSISSDRILNVFTDNRNKIWIGTLDKGLDLLDTETGVFTNYSYEPGADGALSIGAVISIYEDVSGGIWIGTYGGGISRYDPLNQNFIHIQPVAGKTNGISPNPVLAICEDHLGNLWVGSDGGGVNVRGKNSNDFKTYLQHPGFGSNAITAICEDRNGNIWLGTDPGANSSAGVVIKYNRQAKTFSQLKNISIKVRGVSAIHEDRYGELWITTSGDGIHRYNPATGKEVVYRHDDNNPQTVSSNSVFSICEDSCGNLWFGSPASGLNLFNRETNSFTRFSNDPKDKNSLSNNTVWCIAEDKNRNLWIGTSGGGLNKFNRQQKSFTQYTVENGLSTNIIYSLVPDDDGNLWISTSRGITKFNISSETFRNFDKSTGLYINDFTAGASFKTGDGKIYFGGNTGVVLVNPNSVKENSFIPNVVVTDFRVFGKSFPLENSILFTKEINLSYNQNFFTIEFASLDYTSPEKNIFEYKLEGVDKDWIKSAGRRFASYTDITSGHYIFKVRGSNSSGVFNNKEAILEIIISPPFWETWWFRFVCLFAFALLLYSAHKYRLNKLLEIERTRIKIANNLHDEVSSSITGIVYFADAIMTEVKEKETPVVKKYLGLISESAAQIQGAMGDIIWSINPTNDDWRTVLPKFRRFASDLCESKGIKYWIDIPENISDKKLKMERRHDLWLLYKEIVVNAVKHSRCTEITINLFTNSDYLHLEINDNGKGFDAEKKFEGNGLKNIHSRCKALAGTVSLTTSIGNSTKWEIKIPLS